MTRRLRRFRLVPVALLVWGTAAAATMVPAIAPVLAAAAWIATAVAMSLLLRPHARLDARPHARRRVAVVVVLACAAAAVVASHVVLAQPARTALVTLSVDGGRAVELTARVVGKIERRAATGQLVFDAVTSRAATGPVARSVDLPVSIGVQPDDVDGLGELDVGAVIVVRGTTRPADPGERSVVLVTASAGVEVVEPPSGPEALAGALRDGLVAATRGLPDPGGGLVAGLAVGDTSGVGADLDAAMKASSLSHLTAVSGANCALVVGLAFAGAALLGARRGVRVGVGIAALVAFVVLVTPEPSVARAAAMAAVAMLAVVLGRSAAGVAVLCLAVTVLLAVDPWLSTSLGFALSSVATASLLLLARPLAAGLERWMPRALALGFSVPLAAQLACGPLLVLIAPTIPLYGVIANLLAAPAAPVATVVGLAACLALPIPVLQSGLAALAWVPAAWIAATATTFAELPGGQVPWLEGWWGLAALTVLGAAVIVLLGPRSHRTRVVRAVAGALVAVVVGGVAGGAALAGLAGPLTLPPAWAILVCDVGQGDAVLVRSAGEVALVDTGPDPGALESCLTRAGVGHLDLLVLTHFDADHSGGVDAVVGRVDQVLHGPPGSDAHEHVLDALARGGATLVAARTGLEGELGAAAYRVVWPRAESRAYPPGNDASVVVEIRGGGIPPALFLGDLSASPQRAIEASGALAPPYDVVKVAHHGSADQEPELYRAARPAVALVTVGLGNDYGHPRQEILDVLSELGAVVARTDRQGVVAVWIGAGSLQVWRERAVGVGPAG
ncbi:ComEC/Rec2 family competence protein [Microbacterium sp. SS28]|uniref:ComEC/Rec2 family competence protein n=1 Tax=Microbacterium sp. SS28 TaxID=2919948 RepID=UPI001FAB1806|nr:ComEC/Rec2 family competence protein [Microbacterium sp. SS28]